MAAPAIPARLPATGGDLTIVTFRGLGMHTDLGCRLTFAERLDATLLQRAVRLTLDVEPVLGCALETGFLSGAWRRLDDLDAHVPFEVTETSDPDAEWLRFVSGTVADTGPQVFVALIRAAGHDEVCIRLAHTAGDGRSAKVYPYLLAEQYTRLSTDPGHLPEPRLSPRPSTRDAMARLSEEQLRASAAAARMPAARAIRYKGWTGGGRTIRERIIAPEAFAAVREYAKMRDASVHEMLLTAFARGLWRALPEPRDVAIPVGFSVDYRRFLDEAAGDRIANVSGAVGPSVSCPGDDDFEQTLAGIRAQAAAFRDASWDIATVGRLDRMLPAGLGVIGWLFGVLGRRAGRRGDAAFSLANLGVIDETRLGFGEIRPVGASTFGPAIWGGGIDVCASTYRGAMTLSLGFCADDQDASVPETVLDTMVRELEACPTEADSDEREAR